MKPIPVVKGSHTTRVSMEGLRGCLLIELVSSKDNWLAMPTRHGYSIFKIQPGWSDYMPSNVEFIRFLFEETDTASRKHAWREALILDRQVPITGKRA